MISSAVAEVGRFRGNAATFLLFCDPSTFRTQRTLQHSSVHAQLTAVRAKSPLNLPPLFAKQPNPGRTNKAVSPAAVGRLSQVIVSGICGLGHSLAGWLAAWGGPPGLPSHLGKVNKRGPGCACVVDYSMYSHNHGQANLSRNQNSARARLRPTRVLLERYKRWLGRPVVAALTLFR